MARVVVVGGGLGGTAAAARLAKLGHSVTLVERSGRLGGAVGLLERDGFCWDTGPTSTGLPGVVRDLFRKSGRPLERELELVPVQPMREHRFPDGTVLSLPSGSRSAQADAVDAALGPGRGQQWVDYAHSFADTWDVLRRGLLERPYSPDVAAKQVTDLLRSRATLHKVVRDGLVDPRLRTLAVHGALMDGQDPVRTPGWLGMTAYVEQNFGTWTVPGGMGLLAAALTKRLDERRVDVVLHTDAEDVVLEAGRVVGVRTAGGPLDADVVVCAVDPHRLPVLAPFVRRTLPATPPSVSHLGLAGEGPGLPHEVVLHGSPTFVLRTNGSAPAGAQAWTVLSRGPLEEDLLDALAHRGVEVRDRVAVRVDRSPRELLEAGSPYGVLWQGRRTFSRKLSTRTPLPGVFCVGASVAAMPGIPYVGLTASVVAAEIGPA